MPKILLLILCSLAVQLVVAQPSATPNDATQDAAAPVLSAESYADLKLPPLHLLMENARERSPQVKMFDSKRESEERELKTIRRAWMNYFKLNGTISYGTSDVNNQVFTDNQYPIVQSVSGTTQRWWNVGASISVPLGEIFNRRNKNKQQKKRIEGIAYEADMWYDEVCLTIIECYADAVENLNILKPTTEAMVAARAQYVSAENDFVNGKIDASELSHQKSIESSAIREYQKVRGQLLKAILKLEVLSKTPIISSEEEILPQ